MLSVCPLDPELVRRCAARQCRSRTRSITIRPLTARMSASDCSCLYERCTQRLVRRPCGSHGGTCPTATLFRRVAPPSRIAPFTLGPIPSGLVTWCLTWRDQKGPTPTVTVGAHGNRGVVSTYTHPPTCAHPHPAHGALGRRMPPRLPQFLWTHTLSGSPYTLHLPLAHAEWTKKAVRPLGG